MTHCTRCGKTNPAEIHTCTPPLALLLADELEATHPALWPYGQEAAAELRRLHAENGALRESLKTEELISFRRQMQGYAAQVEADEALLRRALHMMEESHYAVADAATHNDVMEHFAVIEALRERLGVSE